MSRIGRLPSNIPAGVDVTLAPGEVVVKGPRGQLTQRVPLQMQIAQQDGQIVVTRPSDDKMHKSLHGLTRTLIANMVEGVTNGYRKTLEISGVGYRAGRIGNRLTLQVGFSHPVEIMPPTGIEF